MEKSLCLYVCLSTCISQNPHVQTSGSFLYMLPVAVPQFSSDNNAICYVFLVLWMTSCYHIMHQTQIQAWSVQRSELFTVGWRREIVHPGVKSAVASCIVLDDIIVMGECSVCV